MVEFHDESKDIFDFTERNRAVREERSDEDKRPPIVDPEGLIANNNDKWRNDFSRDDPPEV